MKKMIFVVIIFVSLILIAEETNPNETNRILYDGWVTGPGSPNKHTYLLPFGYFPNDTCSQTYIDEHPLLYETDMGWPVPNADETELKYLFFGDTKFFMRDNNQHVVGKITDLSGEEIYNFNLPFYLFENTKSSIIKFSVNLLRVYSLIGGFL